MRPAALAPHQSADVVVFTAMTYGRAAPLPRGVLGAARGATVFRADAASDCQDTGCEIVTTPVGVPR